MVTFMCRNYTKFTFVDDDFSPKTVYYCDRYNSDPFNECHCGGNPNKCDHEISSTKLKNATTAIDKMSEIVNDMERIISDIDKSLNNLKTELDNFGGNK